MRILAVDDEPLNRKRLSRLLGGERLSKPMPRSVPICSLAMILNAPTGLHYRLSHHEKWDGSGFPNALLGEAISLAARIVAVADGFDVLTSSRPSKKPGRAPSQQSSSKKFSANISIWTWRGIFCAGGWKKW